MKGLINISIKIFLLFNIFNFLTSFFLSLHNFISHYKINKDLYEINIIEDIKMYVPFVLICCLYILIIIFMWTKTEYISNKIINTNKIENLNFTLDYKNALSIGLIILSIYLIISSFPRIFSYLSNWLISKSRFVDKDYLKDYTIREVVELFGIFVKILASYLLIKYNENIIDRIINRGNKK